MNEIKIIAELFINKGVLRNILCREQILNQILLNQKKSNEKLILYSTELKMEIGTIEIQKIKIRERGE